MEETITDIYKEIKLKRTQFRLAKADHEIVKFLTHLMEEIEEKIFYPNHCGDVMEDETES